MVTEYPRASSNRAKDAEIIPFPNEEATPPVTKMYFVFMTKFIAIIYKGTKKK
jgi:hypothetical protein